MPHLLCRSIKVARLVPIAMRSRSDLNQNSAEGSLLLALGQVEQRDPLMLAENSVLETSEINAHFLKAACGRFQGNRTRLAGS
jgi:hypothetical protein